MRQNRNSSIRLALVLASTLTILAGCASKPEDAKVETTAEQAAKADTVAKPVAPVLAALNASQQQAYSNALAAQMAKQWPQALSSWQQLAAQLPNYPGVLYNLALVQLQLNQADDAQKTVQQLLTIYPTAVEALNLSGAIARSQGQFRQAERQYLAAIAVQADHANAHKNLAFLYDLYLDNPAKAREHYERYQALTNDEQAKAWLGLLPAKEANP
ncbi:MAG: tetratricopeptide repeat protein [Rheinheimera sp.]|nr:tetratricopeptide repeat protein [Rheinheimera sp.]